MHKIHIAADACKYTAEKMRNKLCSLYVDTQESGALGITADCVEISSEPGPAEEAEQKDNYYDGNYNTDLDISRNIHSFLVIRSHERNLDPGASHLDESFVFNVERICIDYGRHALCEEESCERNNEGLDLKVSNEGALDYAESKADSHCQAHGGYDVSAALVEEHRAAHADEGCNLTYGDVDAAGDHYEAHAA